MEHEWIVDGRKIQLGLEAAEGRWRLTFEDVSKAADIRSVSPNEISMVIDGRQRRIVFAFDGDKGYFRVDGREYLVEEPASGEEEFAGRSEGGEARLFVRAPMPGKVIQICVSEGDEVRKNQTLVIVEAMKMENEIKAGLNARVKKIDTRPGDLVDPAHILIELEPITP